MKLLLKLTACCLLIMAYSCSEPSLVGEELLDEAIPFDAFFTDTVTVKLSTVKEDKLKTDSLGNYLIGNIEDKPEFGNTRASVFTQVRLATNEIDLVSSTSELPVYDSLVLRLAYNFHYGDSTAAQTIKVFEVTEDFENTRNTYYQSDKLAYNTTPVGVLDNYKHQFSGSITLRRPTAFNADTTIVDTTETPTHLRIKLDDDLGERFFAQSGQTAFRDNDEFLKFFKGFHIAVDKDASDRSLMVSYALETSSVSSLLLYYHTEGQDSIYVEDTLGVVVDSFLVTTYNHQTLGFPINFGGNTFNQIINDYGRPVFDALNSSAGNEGDELAYIQGGGGLHIKVEFPNIKNEYFDNVLINKATLNLYQVPSANAKFNPPALISMYDAELYNDGFYGNNVFEARSLLNTDTATQKMQYNFNFPALLQNIIEGENSEEIILVPVNNSFTTNRAIIAGDTNDDLKAKLELIYTLTE